MLSKFIIQALLSSVATYVLFRLTQRTFRITPFFVVVLLGVNVLTAFFGNMVIVLYVLCGWGIVSVKRRSSLGNT